MFTFLNLLSKPNVEIEYDCKKYSLSPITFKLTGEFIQWYKWKPYHETIANTKDTPVELREELLKETFNECKKKVVSIEDADLQAAMIQPEGVAYMLYLSLRVRHPEMTENLASEIVSMKGAQEMLTRIDEASGIGEDEQEKELGESLGQLTQAK